MRRLRVGINGLGRIGRAVFRINLKHDVFDIVAVNDINPDNGNLAYLLQYDSTYGALPDRIEGGKTGLVLNDKKIAAYHEKRIINVPWEKHDVDLVIDSSGAEENVRDITGYSGSVKQFILTNAPVGYDGIRTIVFGVNDDDPEIIRHKIISASICDTIALGPILSILKTFGEIESGFLTTLHPWLYYQNLLDGACGSFTKPDNIFSQYALGRSVTNNMIPKTTTAVTAADFIFPGISDIIKAVSYRVPTSIVSSAILVVMMNREIDQKELAGRFDDAERKRRPPVVRTNREPLTAIDFKGNEASAIIDQRWTSVQNGKHVELVYWYDNEWGYSSRVVDIVKLISEHSRG